MFVSTSIETVTALTTECRQQLDRGAHIVQWLAAAKVKGKVESRWSILQVRACRVTLENAKSTAMLK